MTPQEINIEIAKVCGWKRTAEGSWEKPETCKMYYQSMGTWCVEYAPPNYYHDLNAMHEAEEVLSDLQIATYAKELQRIVKPAFGTPHYRRVWWANFIRATAAQRAEAFLRTLNLWRNTA